MTTLLSRAWWMLAMRGAIAIVFGILALLWPDLSLLALVVLFAVYAVFGGAAALAGAIGNRRADEDWWLLLLLGLVSLGAGIVAIIHPALTALLLVLLIGANAIVTGVLDIAIAIRLRKVLRNEWLLILIGLASVVFGLFLFLYPGAGALALIGLIAFYAIVVGILMLALAARMRSQTRAQLQINRRVIPDRRQRAGLHP